MALPENLDRCKSIVPNLPGLISTCIYCIYLLKKKTRGSRSRGTPKNYGGEQMVNCHSCFFKRLLLFLLSCAVLKFSESVCEKHVEHGSYILTSDSYLFQSSFCVFDGFIFRDIDQVTFSFISNFHCLDTLSIIYFCKIKQKFNTVKTLLHTTIHFFLIRTKYIVTKN